jgi:hypothetical protein
MRLPNLQHPQHEAVSMQRENDFLSTRSLIRSLVRSGTTVAHDTAAYAVRWATRVAMRHGRGQGAVGDTIPNPPSEGVVVVRFRGRRPVHVAGEDNLPRVPRPFVDLRTLSVRTRFGFDCLSLPGGASPSC